MTEIMKAAVRLCVPVWKSENFIHLVFADCTDNIAPSGSAARVSVAVAMWVSTVAQTGEKDVQTSLGNVTADEH
jgi:hypothetical protein